MDSCGRNNQLSRKREKYVIEIRFAHSCNSSGVFSRVDHSRGKADLGEDWLRAVTWDNAAALLLGNRLGPVGVDP